MNRSTRRDPVSVGRCASLLVLGEIGEGIDATGAIGDPVRPHVAVHRLLQMVSPALLHVAVGLDAGGVAELPSVRTGFRVTVGDRE